MPKTPMTITTHGTVNGATLTTNRDNVPGSAYDFDGADDRIVIDPMANLPIGENFTISWWIRPDNVSGVASVITNDSDANGNSMGGIVCNISSGSLNCYIPGKVGFGAFVSANQWQMFTYVKEGNIFKLYKNGVLQKTAVSSAVPSSNGIWAIGAHHMSTGWGRFLNGKIDDVRIEGCAMSAQEILDLYNAVPFPVPASLDYLSSFDQNVLGDFWSTGTSGPEGKDGLHDAAHTSPPLKVLKLARSVTTGPDPVVHADLRADLSTASNDVVMTVGNSSYGDPNASIPAETGVFLSDDGGQNFIKVFNQFPFLNDCNGCHSSFQLNLTQMAAQHNLALNANFVIRFRHKVPAAYPRGHRTTVRMAHREHGRLGKGQVGQIGDRSDKSGIRGIDRPLPEPEQRQFHGGRGPGLWGYGKDIGTDLRPFGKGGVLQERKTL